MLLSKEYYNRDFSPFIRPKPQGIKPSARIKRSRFLVADVTGGRQGVYFEGGFAKGLGLPVIWTCSHGTDAELKKWMHFDTRQYNHI